MSIWSALAIALVFSPTAFAGVSGQLKSTTDHYPSRLGKPVDNLVPYVSLELHDKYKLQKSLRAQWKTFALVNAESKYPPENFYGDIHEAFFEYRAGESKWRLGLNTVNWGVVDISSPSDVVNTVALFHPLRTMKQGAPMLELKLGEESLNLHLIYIPVQRPGQLPSQDSRWLPREFLLDTSAMQLGAIRIPPVMEYTYDPPETFSRALNNNFGAKIASHLASLDLQVTHFEGVAPVAKVRPTVLNLDSTPDGFALRSPTGLTPIYYRVRTTGFGFSWAANDKWIFRGESAYQHTISENAFLQTWVWSNVLAAETNVDVAGSNVILLAQFYYSKNPQPADNFLSSSYRIFDQTAVLGARWAHSDDTTILASTLYETITQGLFWTVGFENKISDQLKWGASWRDFSAKKEGLLKTFGKNDHASMDLIYFF